MNLRQKVMGVVALSSLAIVLAGCEDHSAEQMGKTIDQTVGKAGDVVDDATVTMKVKIALAREPDLKSLQMDVDTSSGIVTLNGIVDSQQSRDKAAAIAQGVEGVKSVVNRLIVESASSRRGPAMRRFNRPDLMVVYTAALGAGSFQGRV
ncbi:MAG: BON domain-containing protein [Candidatus Competibacteraceae bacterium]